MSGIIHADAARQLTYYDAARAALAEALRVDDVKDVVNKAAATAEYARRAKDGELLGYATSIRLYAERRAGELLAEMKATGERDSGHGDRKSGSQAAIPKLDDLGVTKTQSSRWQALAALDDDEFEARADAAKRQAVASVEATREERATEKKGRRQAREADLGARQAALPNRRFGVILADPPWKFAPYSRESGMDRAADNHYPTLDLEAIKTLDVESIAAPDCVLFLWATAPMHPEALAVMAAWGFAFKSSFVWVKDRVGTGYWTRNRHELLLIGTRGDVPAPAPGTQSSSAVMAPAGKHSAKPDVFHYIIEQYFPTLPKVELFCRGAPRPGWTAWGNQTEGPS